MSSRAPDRRAGPRRRRPAGRITAALLCILLLPPAVGVGAPGQEEVVEEGDESCLSWSRERATAIGEGTRVEGRAGGFFDTRIRHTERSYNYELRVTWLTPAVIRATARILQIDEYLTDDRTRALVEEAEAVDGTVMLVEIDPNEGSGVIPLDWLALLRPAGVDDPARIVRGTSEPGLRRVRALQGVKDVRRAELTVRIHDKEELVGWRVPASIRALPQQAAAR